MRQKVFKTFIGVVLILSLVFTLFFILSMVKQYNESLRWDNSSLLTDIHNVPPELAKNYVSGNEEELAQALTEVNNALDTIREEDGISGENIDEFDELSQRAKGLLVDSGLEDGQLATPLNSLLLYVQIERSINEAYEQVTTGNLKDYSDRIANRLNERNNDIDNLYLDKLVAVAIDFKNLEDFSKRTIESLGYVESNVLHVNLRVDKSISQRILDDISASNIDKFKNIKSLEELLQGEPWDDILAHNQSTKEFYSWEESKEILESLHHSNYKKVSDFKTLQDAVDYQPNINLERRYGYEIDLEDSTIDNVYCQGVVLDNDEYVRKGTRLSFDVYYSYIEIEKPEINIEDDLIDLPTIELEPDTDDELPQETPKLPEIAPETEKPIDKPDDKTSTDEDANSEEKGDKNRTED